jgi:hypothetical protein
MSIEDITREWERDGSLVVLKPFLKSTEMVRYVIATKEVNDEICGPWDTRELEIRYSRVRTVIDAFIGGLRIAARWPPSKSIKANLALLDPADEQVWEFRSPRPGGIRVFGRFANINVFVALGTELREEIDDDFTREKEACKRAWRRFYPSYDPLNGQDLADFLTDFHRV